MEQRIKRLRDALERIANREQYIRPVAEFDPGPKNLCLSCCQFENDHLPECQFSIAEQSLREDDDARGKNCDEFADLRAKLAAATERAEKAELAVQEQRLLTETVRAGMQSLGRTLEDCRLDKHAVEVQRDRMSKCVTDAIARAEAAEAEVERLLVSRYFTRCREGAVDHSCNCATWGDDGLGNVGGKPVHPPCNCGASWNWAKKMETERDAAKTEAQRLFADAAQWQARAVLLQKDLDAARAGEASAVEALVERLRAALEEVYEKADDWHSSVEWEGREYTGAVIEVIDRALSVAPPAALEELRRRERSIGAEEELRRLATVADGNWAADELSDRADQIRDAREKGGAE